LHQSSFISHCAGRNKIWDSQLMSLRDTPAARNSGRSEVLP
jgi:hypothetical protein